MCTAYRKPSRHWKAAVSSSVWPKGTLNAASIWAQATSTTNLNISTSETKPTCGTFQRAVQNSGLSNPGFILGVRYQWASRISLVLRTPWTQPSFDRVYFSSNKSRRRESRISDEDKYYLKDQDKVKDDSEDEALDEQQISDSDNYEVLDEQRISDSEDDGLLDEEYISDDSEVNEDDDGGDGENQLPSKVPAKKKFDVHAPKPKPVNEGPILNEKITAKTLRLVDDEGGGHRIVLRDEALFLAKRKKLDLVLVDRKADPPVCKIFDFNRAKYQKEQTMKELKKKKGAAAKLGEIKELRYSSKTELKDLQMKVDKAKQFLEHGYKVKFVANFPSHIEEVADRMEQGKMIHEVISMMNNIAIIEQGPRFEARLVWVMFRHTKFGKPKKKPPKLAAQPVETAVHSNQVGEYETANLKV